MGVKPHLYFCKDTKETEKGELASAEKAVTKKEFQGEWTVLAPRFIATWSYVAAWSEACKYAGPLCLFSTCPLRTGVLSQPLEDSAAPTAQAEETTME